MVLVHSPLVGPATWRWVAEELAAASGRDVVVPSLVDGARAGSWRACVDAAGAQLRTPQVGGDVTIVGHSGAGPLLPVIAAGLERPPVRLVFVDAAVPPEEGDASLVPDEFARHLRNIAREGLLPPWSEWFGSETMANLVPDADRRRLVVDEMPQLPIGYFTERITLPPAWSDAGTCGYVLLSEVYRPDADEARARGWPVVELLGSHLDLVTRAADVARAIERVVGRLPGASTVETTSPPRWWHR